MGFVCKAISGVFFGLLTLLVVRIVVFLYFPQLPPVPKIEKTWWGKRDPALEQSEVVQPFFINVPQEMLTDLESRLNNTSVFQTPLENSKHHYGINTNLLQEFLEFWKTKYDWKEREKFLNQFPQFHVSIQGLYIHFLHIKPQDVKGKKVIPLLLVHGWPGSVREFYDMIPMLATPQEGRDYVFEVIAPSLPGYGFSEATGKPGFATPQIAVILKRLMEILGHEKFYVQGGDWGSIIVRTMSVLYPENVLGMHSNMCSIFLSIPDILKLWIGSYFPSLLVTEEEKDFVYPLAATFSSTMLETGYLHLQATKPDTIGVALRDSPIGLAAYMLEKFITWTNTSHKDLDDGNLDKKYGFEKLLDNIMIYWTTKSITTSMRIYAECIVKENRELQLEWFPVTLPSACARFTHELFLFPPEKLLREQYLDLVQTTINEGGHFAAFEVPDVLANDIWSFVEKVEERRQPDGVGRQEEL